jgi:hypothetical protein
MEAIYHDFDSDKQSLDFGSELNLSATTKLSERYTLGANYADYSSGDPSSNKSDVQKFWLWGEAQF